MEIKNKNEILKMVNMKEKEYYMMKMDINYMKEILKMMNWKERE